MSSGMRAAHDSAGGSLEPGLVTNQHPGCMTEPPSHEGAQVIADHLGVPHRGAQ